MCHAVYVVASFRLHSCYFHYIPRSFSLYHTNIIHTLPQLKTTRCLNHQSLFHSTPTNQTTTVAAPIMCIKIVERYAVCRCVYHSHAVDPCPAYGRRGHSIKTQDVLVGYTCSRHTVHGSRSGSSHHYNYPDSGYGSGSTSGRNADGSFRR